MRSNQSHINAVERFHVKHDEPKSFHFGLSLIGSIRSIALAGNALHGRAERRGDRIDASAKLAVFSSTQKEGERHPAHRGRRPDRLEYSWLLLHRKLNGFAMEHG